MEKSAVIMSSHKLSFPEQTKQKLPLEAASMFIRNEKITTDPGRALRHEIGNSKARKFYMDRGIMNAETLDLVAWEAVRDALNKNQSYTNCGTGSRGMDTVVPEKCSSIGTTGQTLGAQARRREWKLANNRIDATTGSE